jgi:hypothetical protein
VFRVLMLHSPVRKISPRATSEILSTRGGDCAVLQFARLPQYLAERRKNATARERRQGYLQSNGISIDRANNA